jgi:peptidoglycan/LPS O-acetylase OafA/YrhL
MNSKFRFDIQVIRGLALLSVLFFHAKPAFFPLGYLGVDLFFVVSGFVVTPLILNIFSDGNSFSEVKPRLREFYKRRFLRLVPALTASILCSLVLIFFLGPIQDHRKIMSQGVFSVFGIANIGAIFFSGDYFAPHPNAFIHTWSLSVEEQFYLLLPILLFLSLKIKNRKISSVKSIYLFITVFSLILFLSPSVMDSIYAIIFNAYGNQFHFYSPLSRAWQFTLGGLAYLIGSKFEIRNLSLRKALGIIVGISLLLLLFNPIRTEGKFVGVLATSMGVFAIYFRSGDLLPNLLRAPIAWLGNRSYSIYLLHLPLIYLAKYSPLLGASGKQNRSLQTFIAVLLSIILGSFFYSRIENRYRLTSKNLNVRHISSSKALLFLLVPSILMSLLIIVPYQAYLGDKNLPPNNVDIPWEVDRDCRILKNDSALDRQPCVYHATSSENVLLFGDSHAASFAEIFKSIAKENKVNLHVSTYSDCPFVLSTKDYLKYGNVVYFSSGCLNHNRDLVRYIQANNITQLFYAQRARVEDGDEQIVSTLSKLELLGTRVVVIGMNPEYLPITSVLGNFFKSKGFYNSNIQLIDQDWENLSAINGLEYIDVYEKLCPFKICSTRIGSSYIFFDDNHLSTYGASQFKSDIQNELSSGIS